MGTTVDSGVPDPRHHDGLWLAVFVGLVSALLVAVALFGQDASYRFGMAQAPVPGSSDTAQAVAESVARP